MDRRVTTMVGILATMLGTALGVVVLVDTVHGTWASNVGTNFLIVAFCCVAHTRFSMWLRAHATGEHERHVADRMGGLRSTSRESTGRDH